MISNLILSRTVLFGVQDRRVEKSIRVIGRVKRVNLRS